MNRYSTGFYTLMSEAGILSSESFSLYVRDVVGFGNIQDLNLDGFTWEPYSSLTFDYQQLIVSNRLKVMATYTDKDSEAIPFGTEGFNATNGVIPRQKARFIWDEDDYRKYLDAVSKLDFQNTTAKQYALDLLFNGLSDIKSAHELSMTYQRDQMVSNRGLTLSADNNPRGIKGITFTASVPDANVTTLAGNYRWFTDADKTVEGSSADPVKDMRTIIRSMRRKGYNNIALEVDEQSWLADMDHSKWRTAAGYIVRPDLVLAANNDANALIVGKNLGDDQMKEAFARIIGIPLANIKFRQGLAAVETLSGKGPDATLVRTSMRTFNANTYVFYPEGPLGTIKSVAPLVPDASAMYATFFGGKGLIQYEYDAKAKTQDWWSELTALCVPNRPQEMFYLITYSASGSNGGQSA
jgi:hypothetical protein